jgi:hypothetical protein
VTPSRAAQRKIVLDHLAEFARGNSLPSRRHFRLGLAVISGSHRLEKVAGRLSEQLVQKKGLLRIPDRFD